MNLSHRNNRGRAGRLSATVLTVLFCFTTARPALGQTISTDPQRTIIPVHFDNVSGDITIGQTTYKGQSGGWHILALRRQPNRSHLDAPDVVFETVATPPWNNQVINALTTIETAYPDAMVMVNAAGNYGFNIWEVGYKLVDFGGPTELGAINSYPFVFVGIAGRVQGTAPLVRWTSTRPVDGYLAADSRGNYAFIQTDFVRYDINLNGDINVGTKTYTVANSYRVNCNGQNALHVVIVDREDPTIAYMDNTYCTAASDFEIQRVIGDLNTLTSNLTDETRLVFFGSNGKPIPANWNFGTDGDARFYPLAQQVRRLGGYWETIVYLSPSDTYSLVGAVPPPAGTKGASKRARESSSVYPEISAGVRPSGELHGVLARSGRGNFYSPLNADPSGYANLGFYQVLATPNAAFPHPVGAAEIAAFQSINQRLCAFNAGTACGDPTYNIRDLYDDTTINIGNDLNALRSYTDANGRNCDTAGSNADANFCAVRAQLLTEFAFASNIQKFYSNVSGVLSNNGTVTIFSQLSAVNDIKSQLNPPPAASSQSLVSPLVNLFLSLGSFIPEVGPLFGLADVAFNFGTSLTTDAQGNKTIDLSSTMANLYQQSLDQFTSQQSTTGTLFQLVYQDWGKLNALGTALGSAQNESSPWFWSTSATGKMLTQLTPAIRQAAYQNIMPAAYAIGSFFPNSITGQGWGWGKYPLSAQPYAYVVETARNAPYVPTNHPLWVQPQFLYYPYTFPNDPGNEWANDTRSASLLTDGGWLAISALNTPITGTTDDFQYSPPSDDIRSLLFKPVWNNGLGVYRPAFFQTWPFPRVTCDPSFGNRSGDHTWVGGCNWSAAAAAPELLAGGRAVTSVTMRASQTSRQPDQTQQSQVSIALTVHNNGTRTAQSITIDSIMVRTLGGSGQATLTGQTLPIRLTNLRPGDSTAVFVKLNVPPGVTRVSLTEQGTITPVITGAPEVFRFSEAQALVLQ